MRLTKLLTVLGIFLTLLLIALGIFVFFIHTCNISQNKDTSMLIKQETTLGSNGLAFGTYRQPEEQYFVKTNLILRWKICSKGVKYNKHKDIYTLRDLVKCKDIEKTKISQMEEVMKYKISLEECLRNNPSIILTK